MCHSARGIESLPVVLVLGAVLAACTLGLGARAMIQVTRINERQKAIDSFNSFVERVRMVCAGGIGSAQRVELELGDAEITIESNIVKLVSGEEVLRCELLPLPLVVEGSNIGGGDYTIELRRSPSGEYFLEVKKAPDGARWGS